MRKIFGFIALAAALSAFPAALAADEPPSAPGMPHASKTTFTKAVISWAAATDDVGVVSYKIYRNGVEIADTTGTTYSDDELAAGTQYTYTVKAVDTASQLSDASPGLIFKTLEPLTIDDAALVQQVVDSVDSNGLTASELIAAVQNAFAELGFDSSFDKVDVSLLTELVQQRLDDMEPDPEADPETSESRAADQAELDQILLDHYEGHSFLELYIQSNLTELAEKHFQAGKSDSAITLYDYSLEYLSDVETCVCNTLNRISHIKLSAIDDDTSLSETADILHDSKATLMRFFDYFPGSTDHFAQGMHVKAAFDYFWRFPELLSYDAYDQTVFDGAVAMIQAAKAMDDSALNAVRLDRISSWELESAVFEIVDPDGNPLATTLTITNVSDTSRYPEDPLQDVRVFELTGAASAVPLYLGHHYDVKASVFVDGGNPWIWNLSDIPHEKGKRYVFDHGGAPTVSDLNDPTAPAEIRIISSQPTAPYNLKAEKFVDTFTLSWDFVPPSGFQLKEFKVFRGGSEIGTTTSKSLAGIPLDIGNNTFTYTVRAYDVNDAPSDESRPLTVTPDFTDEQQAWFDWKTEHFGSAPMYDYEDPDNDGVSNYHEFLLGSDPNLAPVQDPKTTISDAVPGLMAEYFQLGDTEYKLPSFDSLTPVSSEIVTDMNFTADSDAILGSGISDHVAVRMRGYIDVPADGLHRFHLKSDDGSKLLIDGRLVINNDYRHSVRDYSGDVSLKAGVHSIEIQYFEYTGSGTLELSWAGPGFSRTQVTSDDLWHTPNPTALLDESLAQNRDSDDDGIIDAVEYQLGTDIDSVDSDGDGISDYDEVYLTKTDPVLADTDGDGFSDYDEIFNLLSDPNSADVSDSVTDVLSIDGSAAVPTAGEWSVVGSAIAASGRNGTLRYSLDVPAAATYRLAVEISENNAYASNSSFTLALTVDGTYVGKNTVDAPYGTTGTALFYLPRLDTGTHTVSIRWDNVVSNSFLKVDSLTLQLLGGPDADGNGIPDWIDNRNAKLAELSVPAASTTSPVCVEGAKHLNIGNLSISGYFTPPGEEPVDPVLKPVPNDKWYADVPLSPNAATVLSFDFNNGTAPTTKTTTWTETNVMTAPDAVIRLGDSLLLAGFPDGAVAGTTVVEVDGETLSIDYDASNDRNSVPHLFDYPGDHVVTATYTPLGGGDPVSGSMTVKVVSSTFSNAPVALIGKSRSWLNPNIAPETVVESDSWIDIFESPLDPTGRDFEFKATADKTGYVAARLGENGPITDSKEVRVIQISIIPSGKHRVIETFADGSIMVESTIILGYVPPDLKMRLRIYTGGVTFDDGTIERWVHASDFDQYGVYKYRFIRADGAYTGICHAIEIYQGDERIK